MPYKGLHVDLHAQSLLTRLENRLASAAIAGDNRTVFMLTETYAPATSTTI